MGNDGNSALRDLLTDAVLIAGATAGAYLLAFVYEASYLGHFGIPRDLVQVGLTSILVALAAVGFALLIILILLDSVLSFIPSPEDPLGRAFRRIAVPGVLVLMYLVVSLVYGRTLENQLWWLLLIALWVAAVVEFLLPLVMYRSVKGYRGKLEKQQEADDKVPSSVGRILERAGPLGARAIVWAIFALILTGSVGSAAAEGQDTFLVLNGSPRVVIVRVYESAGIGATLCASEKQVTKELHVLELNSERPMTVEKLGRLESVSKCPN